MADETDPTKDLQLAAWMGVRLVEMKVTLWEY